MVSSGILPMVLWRLLCISLAFPSKNLPHPPVKSVSPVNSTRPMRKTTWPRVWQGQWKVSTRKSDTPPKACAGDPLVSSLVTPATPSAGPPITSRLGNCFTSSKLPPAWSPAQTQGNNEEQPKRCVSDQAHTRKRAGRQQRASLHAQDRPLTMLVRGEYGLECVFGVVFLEEFDDGVGVGWVDEGRRARGGVQDEVAVVVVQDGDRHNRNRQGPCAVLRHFVHLGVRNLDFRGRTHEASLVQSIAGNLAAIKTNKTSSQPLDIVGALRAPVSPRCAVTNLLRLKKIASGEETSLEEGATESRTDGECKHT